MPQPHNLTEGSIAKRLLLFTLPILIGNILQSLNATVNSIWIGHYLGEAALTASSNAGIVLFLVLGGHVRRLHGSHHSHRPVHGRPAPA